MTRSRLLRIRKMSAYAVATTISDECRLADRLVVPVRPWPGTPPQVTRRTGKRATVLIDPVVWDRTIESAGGRGLSIV